MAATMAIMNVVAVASPATVVKSSFRGQRLNAGQQGVSVAARRSSVFVVRAEDKGVGKNLQDAGEQFSAAVQRGAESVRDNLQGSQADASSKAKSAVGSAESKAKQGANEADSVGSKIANQAEDLKDQLFGGGKGAQKDVEKNVNKAKGAAGSAGKDAQKEAGNVLDNVQKGLNDAADNVKDTFKGKN